MPHRIPNMQSNEFRRKAEGDSKLCHQDMNRKLTEKQKD
ncbi:hypothetical protein CPter291_0341 [Collimonas pratensis]|uniref:Uncharacterized protein n=1 Tax=Collimonas pratensis TaxID=279113 RepID=A0ABN4M3M9_9BURK|nr:hypothetical protein CPter291_0341 [Collimonas pratensis]